jgi:hypothetical protein
MRLRTLFPHSPLQTSPGLAVRRFSRPLTSEQPLKDVVGLCGLECGIEVSLRGPAIVKYFTLGLYGYLKLLHFILEYCKTKFKYRAYHLDFMIYSSGWLPRVT